jgi:Flp pilus assembly protein TadG
MNWRRLLSRLVRTSSGNAAIEAALLVPVLVFMVVGIADFGMAVYRKMQVQHAAQAGAEYAIIHGFNSAAVTAAVTGATAFTGVSVTPAPAQSCGCASETLITAAVCGTTCPAGGTAGVYVTVSSQGSYTTLLPYPGFPTNLTFNASSIVRIQ